MSGELGFSYFELALLFVAGVAGGLAQGALGVGLTVVVKTPGYDRPVST